MKCLSVSWFCIFLRQTLSLRLALSAKVYHKVNCRFKGCFFFPASVTTFRAAQYFYTSASLMLKPTHDSTATDWQKFKKTKTHQALFLFDDLFPQTNHQTPEPIPRQSQILFGILSHRHLSNTTTTVAYQYSRTLSVINGPVCTVTSERPSLTSGVAILNVNCLKIKEGWKVIHRFLGYFSTGVPHGPAFGIFL